jgi:putative MATE family efflux protein
VKDLTDGSIPKLLVAMAVPIAIGMIFQTLYFLIDLYFVAKLGDVAIAGVSAAGSIPFVILALTQVLGVGTVALVSHAAGRKDQPEANLVFNQSVLLSAIFGVLTLVGGYSLSGIYMASVAADSATAAAGVTYLWWYTPGLALQFALVAMASALRGTGIVKPTMIVQMLTVVLNAVLAPILIAGWGLHFPLGVAGAGLASTISIACGVIFLWVYFARLEHYVALNPAQWRPRARTLMRVLAIGLPAGGEFFMMFVILVFIYWAIRGFGPGAQAGTGVAFRIMQAIFVPVLAIAFAASPVAGQNFGAGNAARVKETFRASVALSSVVMLAATLLCQWRPEALVGFFTDDPNAVAVGVGYLSIISWNFVANGITFTCSNLFQALGNTVPSLLSSASRLLTFVLPALWLSTRSHFELRQLWYLSVASTSLQSVTSIVLLLREFRRKLGPRAAANTSPPKCGLPEK